MAAGCSRRTVLLIGNRYYRKTILSRFDKSRGVAIDGRVAGRAGSREPRLDLAREGIVLELARELQRLGDFHARRAHISRRGVDPRSRRAEGGANQPFSRPSVSIATRRTSSARERIRSLRYT